MLVKKIEDMDGVNFMSINDFKKINGIKHHIKYDDIILINNDLYRFSKLHKAVVKINNKPLTIEQIKNELDYIDIQL